MSKPEVETLLLLSLYHWEKISAVSICRCWLVKDLSVVMRETTLGDGAHGNLSTRSGAGGRTRNKTRRRNQGTGGRNRHIVRRHEQESKSGGRRRE
jgi:hypothetical protein